MIRASPLPIVLFAVLLLAVAARADEPLVIDATQAWAGVKSHDLLIVDVRTRNEWRQTGTPPGAARISLYDSWGTPTEDFVDLVLAAAGGDRDRPVALICATGGRSAYAAVMLQRAGFSHVADIGEGMVGNDRGMGWLSDALPIEDCVDCAPFAP